jgi:hypothetical protein
MQAKAFMHGIVFKMLEKCPIKYKAVRSLACMNPRLLTQNTAEAIKKFQTLLHCLAEAKRVSLGDIDLLKDQFTEWAITTKTNPAFLTAGKETLVDSLYDSTFPKQQYPVLWAILREMLLISHGQASVERGFSLGKILAKDNQLPETIVNMRLVKDHIVSVGGLKHIVVNSELVSFVSSAHRKYIDDLERKKQDTVKKKHREKRKLVFEDIEGLKKKRKVVEDTVSGLMAEADILYDKAGVSAEPQAKVLKYVRAANSLRHTVVSKKSELAKIEKDLQIKEDELKNIM